MLRRMFEYNFYILFLLIIVFPNSFKFLSILFLAINFTLCIPFFCKKRIEFNVLLYWALCFFITFFYILVGFGERYLDVIPQIIFIYFISPILIFLILHEAIFYFGLKRFFNLIIDMGVVASFSIIAFYFVFFNFGSEYLQIFITEPNIDVSNGIPRVNMHVMGSLIFIFGGFFSFPAIVENFKKRIFVFFLFSVVGILSGRSALILAILIGMAGGLFLQAFYYKNIKVIGYVFNIFIFGIVFVFSISFFGIDLLNVASDLVEKISSSGGDERRDQAIALWNGIVDNFFLGAGHGVGVSLVRNEEYPWRYEILWLATLYRVGLIGAAVYCWPFIFTFFIYVHLFFKKKCLKYDHFIIMGFISIFIAGFTNPYFESFEFQWMYVLPFVYFLIRNNNLKLNKYFFDRGYA